MAASKTVEFSTETPFSVPRKIDGMQASTLQKHVRAYTEGRYRLEEFKLMRAHCVLCLQFGAMLSWVTPPSLASPASAPAQTPTKTKKNNSSGNLRATTTTGDDAKSNKNKNNSKNMNKGDTDDDDDDDDEEVSKTAISMSKKK